MKPDNNSYGFWGSLFGAGLGLLIAAAMSWSLFFAPLLMWMFAAFFGQIFPARDHEEQRVTVRDPWNS